MQRILEVFNIMPKLACALFLQMPAFLPVLSRRLLRSLLLCQNRLSRIQLGDLLLYSVLSTVRGIQVISKEGL